MLSSKTWAETDQIEIEISYVIDKKLLVFNKQIYW